MSKEVKTLLFIILLTLFSVSCSIAPVHSPKTARILGINKWEINAESIPLSFSAYRGLSRDFDIGFTIEAQIGIVYEVSGKYALLNKSDQGVSLSGLGGLFGGESFGSSSQGFRLGPILSYKNSWWEPYVMISYNQVHWEYEFKEKEDDSMSRGNSAIIDIIGDDVSGKGTYRYMQCSLGSSFWLTEGFAINIDAKTLLFFDNDVRGGWLPGLSLIWRL